jgi:hypothetical protein
MWSLPFCFPNQNSVFLIPHIKLINMCNSSYKYFLFHVCLRRQDVFRRSSCPNWR